MTRHSGPLAVAALLLAVASCGDPDLENPPVVASPSAPVFADLTAPEVAAAVSVLAFDPVAASTVIEPIVFLTGRDYCASFGVSPADPRCSRGHVVEESRTKVTLPLDPQVRLRTTRDGDQACRGTITTGATCPATMSVFAAAVHAHPGLPARVTVSGGVVVGLAQLYTP